MSSGFVQLVDSVSESAEDLTTAAERLAEVREYVAGEISRMLESEPGRLLAILYRIDVSETVVLRCLRESKRSTMAYKLADLVIERQLEKVETRKRFSSTPTTGAE